VDCCAPEVLIGALGHGWVQRGGQAPTVRGARAEGSHCAAERLSTRSNTWNCDSARVQMPVGRSKRPYLAKDPV
jgi:hypothetical protein